MASLQLLLVSSFKAIPVTEPLKAKDCLPQSWDGFGDSKEADEAAYSSRKQRITHSFLLKKKQSEAQLLLTSSFKILLLFSKECAQLKSRPLPH